MKLSVTKSVSLKMLCAASLILVSGARADTFKVSKLPRSTAASLYATVQGDALVYQSESNDYLLTRKDGVKVPLSTLGFSPSEYVIAMTKDLHIAAYSVKDHGNSTQSQIYSIWRPEVGRVEFALEAASIENRQITHAFTPEGELVIAVQDRSTAQNGSESISLKVYKVNKKNVSEIMLQETLQQQGVFLENIRTADDGKFIVGLTIGVERKYYYYDTAALKPLTMQGRFAGGSVIGLNSTGEVVVAMSKSNTLYRAKIVANGTLQLLQKVAIPRKEDTRVMYKAVMLNKHEFAVPSGNGVLHINKSKVRELLCFIPNSTGINSLYLSEAVLPEKVGSSVVAQATYKKGDMSLVKISRAASSSEKNYCTATTLKVSKSCSPYLSVTGGSIIQTKVFPTNNFSCSIETTVKDYAGKPLKNRLSVVRRAIDLNGGEQKAAIIASAKTNQSGKAALTVVFPDKVVGRGYSLSTSYTDKNYQGETYTFN
jgi:hypothetical protein